ncbi:MAG: DUF5989 family protein [Planctomycetes bacterium]|jgi:hypothetical protein|nr:DUF5989 family protein [Planctomycetota bacterium]
MADEPKTNSTAEEFARESETKQPGFFADLADFLLHNKKWWLAPIVIVLLLFAVLVILGGTGVAPFVYTLF